MRKQFTTIKNDVFEEILLRDQQRNTIILESAKVCRQREEELKEEIKLYIKEYVDEKNREDTLQLKDWVKLLVADQVQQGQRVQRQFFNKQLSEIRETFNVPGIIGNYTTEDELTGVVKPAFPSYGKFMEHLFESDQERVIVANSQAESLTEAQNRIADLEQQMKKTMTDNEHEKAERKLVQKFDGKFLEFKETLRRQENDYNSKLATMKADVSLVTFDKTNFNFLKDKVVNEWNVMVVGKGKEQEMKISTMEN